jgi:hypothetical protein
MKIIVEKINTEPKHALSKKDIQIVLNKLPFNYSDTVIIFKISRQIFSNSKWDRPVIRNNTTFNILSRGFSKKEILTELLMEIFCNNDSKHFPAFAHQLNTVQRKELLEIIKPYLIEIYQTIEIEE